MVLVRSNKALIFTIFVAHDVLYSSSEANTTTRNKEARTNFMQLPPTEAKD